MEFLTKDFFVLPFNLLGEKFTNNFHKEFDISDHFGITAIQNTYEKLKKENETNINSMKELDMVLKERAWFWNKWIEKIQPINEKKIYVRNKMVQLRNYYYKLIEEYKTFIKEKVANNQFTVEEAIIITKYPDR